MNLSLKTIPPMLIPFCDSWFGNQRQEDDRSDTFTFCSREEGGGALRYRMATHCRIVKSSSGKRQNVGAVNSFGGKKGRR